jgi:transposase
VATIKRELTPISENAGDRRQRRVAQARGLRAQGLLLREIAAEMGVAVQTVFAWLDDPDGSKLRERKERYRGSCVDCGAPTSGSDGRAKAPARCRACAQRRASEQARWTRASIVAAIGEFDRRYGHPPSSNDWNPVQARKLGHHARAERFYADGCWPWSGQVLKVFGRWNDAIRAAGFAPAAPGHYDRRRAAQLRPHHQGLQEAA